MDLHPEHARLLHEVQELQCQRNLAERGVRNAMAALSRGSTREAIRLLGHALVDLQRPLRPRLRIIEHEQATGTPMAAE